MGLSFGKRIQEAAEIARLKTLEAAAAASRTASDPATQEKLEKGLSSAGAGAREAAGMARRGVTMFVERIDPDTLAEVVVKATALQEVTNKALRKKGSPYRISEISISASIPPAVSFAIQRLDDEPEEVGESVHSSRELVEQIIESGDLVLSLDGTTVDSDTVELPDLDSAPGAIPPSEVSKG
jgi:hypothetical protein